MSEIKIISNYKQRDLLSFCHLKKCNLTNDQKLWFDYISSKDDDQYLYRFFKYKGSYYDVFEFMQPPDSFPHYWHRYNDQSGLLIRFSDNNDSVIVGQYCC